MKAGRDLAQARPAEDPPAPDTTPAPDEGSLAGRLHRLSNWQWITVVYLASRILYMGVAFACHFAFGKAPYDTLSGEFHNWDGVWYIAIAHHGYPTHETHQVQSNLGFFPLYPMAMWAVAYVFRASDVVAGMLISGIGGLVGTFVVGRLAADWWGERYLRKAVLFFCIFPGSIVFSMDYSEGLVIPLVAGSLYFLARKRWLLAGILAGLATGIGPDAFPIIPACAVASFLELRRRGWTDKEAWRSLAAVVLSPFGVLAFAAFLWAWTGSPFASYIAQKQGWNERTTPLSLPAWFHSFWLEVSGGLRHVDFNVPVAVLGTFFLGFGLFWLWRYRERIPLEVGVFVAFMTFLMVTSRGVPPNPRLLITAFPVVLVYARRFEKRAWYLTIGLSLVLLVVLSSLTYMARLLRP